MVAPLGRGNVRDATAPTPLPLRQMGALAIVLVNESLSATMLMPFVGLLVAHIQQSSPEEAGYVSGFLVGVFQLAQVFSGKMWGRASDVVGRRPILLCGLAISALSMLMFGLSPSVLALAVTRFIHGFGNGNIVVAKTIVGDITDRTNEAKGFALISFCWGVGSIIGPSFGGLLYDPCNNAALSGHFSCDGPFGRFPALLPCLTGLVYSMLASLVAVLFLKETNMEAIPWRSAIPCSARFRRFRAARARARHNAQHHAHRAGSGGTTGVNAHPSSAPAEPALALGAAAASSAGAAAIQEDATGVPMPPDVAADSTVGFGRPMGALLPTSASSASITPAVTPTGAGGSADWEAILKAPNCDRGGDAAAAAAAAACPPAKPPKKETLSFRAMAADPAIRTAVLLYVILAGGDIVFVETFPLWAIASRSVGGVGVTSAVIGLITMASGAAIIAGNLSYHYCSSMFPTRVHMWRACNAIVGLVSVLVPCASLLSPSAAPFAAAALLSLRMFFASWCFSSAFIFIARVAPKKHLGSVNGAAQASGSLAKMVMPMVAAPLFAFSIAQPRPFPFNHFLTFLLVLALSVACIAASRGFTSPEFASDGVGGAGIGGAIGGYESDRNDEDEDELHSAVASPVVASSVGGRVWAQPS